MLHTTIAWKNGQWLPFEHVHLALDDWGVIQGTVIVDRLRTINTRPLDIELHLARLKSNCEVIGVDACELELLDKVIAECVTHNQSRLADRDFSVVVLVTPGLVTGPKSPTIIVHIQPLKWSALAHWYTHGQQLIVSQHRNVPAVCWSPQLKTRAPLAVLLCRS